MAESRFYKLKAGNGRSLKLWTADKRRAYVFYQERPTEVLPPQDIALCMKREELEECALDGKSLAEQPSAHQPRSFTRMGVVNQVAGPTSEEAQKAAQKSAELEQIVLVDKQELIKTIMSSQKPPYTCSVCGHGGMTKQNLKMHVGSKACLAAARGGRKVPSKKSSKKR